MPRVNNNMYEVVDTREEVVHIADIIIPAEGNLPGYYDQFKIGQNTAIVKDIRGVLPIIDENGNKALKITVTFSYFPG